MQRTKSGPAPEGLQVPLLLSQLPLQQSLPLVQDLPVSRHEAQVLVIVLQISLQHSLSAVQEPPFATHVAAAQVPLEQTPLQHCASFLHFFPSGLHRSSAPASPMPSDASVPPTRAAPISLSALPREMLPLASPLASSSKELAPPSSLVIGYPFPRRAGLVSPALVS
jgi:hypothetical protein